MTTATETGIPDLAARPRSNAGPVMLATFDVPFDEAATAFAVRAAIEASRALIVANVVELPALPFSIQMGYDMLDYTPEMEASLMAPVELAQAHGLDVERLRVKSFRRVEALIEVTREREAQMLVLGPDRRRVSERLYRKAARAVRDRLECLVWITWELDEPNSSRA